MTDDFNKWWNDNVFTKNNPYTNDNPAFWAWEGWHAAVAAEREACANVAAWILKMPENDVSAAIRARGQHD